jgi:hypothetical protein
MTLGSKSGSKASHKTTNPLKARHSQLSSRIANAHILSGRGTISGSSSSHHVTHSLSRVSVGVCLPGQKELLTSTQIQARTAKDYLGYQERLNAMTATQRNALLHSSEGILADDDNDQPSFDILDILSGENPVDISHVGGEFADLLAIGDDLLGPSSR